MSRPAEDLRQAVQRPLSFGQTLRAVAWSFFGVRSRQEHERDMGRLNPVHVIVAGLAGAALFVVALSLLVRWVVNSGAAAN